MANQYPQPTWSGPGPLTPPEAVKRAVVLIFSGAALAIVYGVVNGLTVHNAVFYSYSSTPSGTTVHQANFLATGIVAGIIQCLLWLWMAWKVKAGRGWARVLSTVFFGIFCLGLLVGLIGAVAHAGAIPVFLVALVEWGLGLAAILALWRPESTQFFVAAQQAKLATAYVPPYPSVPYPGQQAPGYPPQPQYGQPPQYGGQPPQYGQPPQDGGPQLPPR
jgi:hypothetical protein